MPLSTEDVMQVLSQLAVEEQLKVTVSESLKGGLIVGGVAAAGGLLGGPVGLAVGGTIGGCLAAASARGKFKPVPQVLNEMSVRQKAELVKRIQAILANVDLLDVISLMTILAGNLTMRDQVLRILLNYLKNELRMQITD